jgi:hypothetical protein
MADKYDVKSNSGKVVGSIEKSSPSYADDYDDGYEYVREPIRKWCLIVGAVLGGLGGALNALKWNVTLIEMVGYIVGGLIIGFLCGAIVGWVLGTVAVVLTYITKNPKEVLIILAVIVCGTLLFIFRDYHFR